MTTQSNSGREAAPIHPKLTATKPRPRRERPTLAGSGETSGALADLYAAQSALDLLHAFSATRDEPEMEIVANAAAAALALVERATERFEGVGTAAAGGSAVPA